jgi:hypothetical protein
MRIDVRGGRLVPYESLPAAVWDVVAPHFSLSMDSTAREDIARAARANAKAPLGRTMEFVSDVATKQLLRRLNFAGQSRCSLARTSSA